MGVRNAVLTFYETTSNLWIRDHIPLAHTPPPIVVYTCLFSLDSLSCSRLCGLLVPLKRALEQLQSALKSSMEGDESNVVSVINEIAKIPWYPEEDRSTIEQYNAFVLDACNALWRNRALETISITLNPVLYPEFVPFMKL